MALQNTSYIDTRYSVFSNVGRDLYNITQLNWPVYDTISQCGSLLQIASSIPVPILSSPFSIVSRIIAEVDKLQNLKDSCLTLVEQATIMICAVLLILKDHPEELPPDMKANVATFEKELKKTELLMEKWARMSWIRRFFKRFTIKKDVESHKNYLNTAYEVFQIEMALDLHVLLFHMHQNMAAIRKTVPEAGREVEIIRELVHQPLPVSPDACIFRHGDFIPDHPFRSKRFLYGKIDHGRLTSNGSVVVRKLYRTDQMAKKEFQRETKAWKALSDSGLVRFLGQSERDSTNPFIILECQDMNLQTGMKHMLNSADVCVSFLNALDVVEGVASALLYLATDFKLGRHEWEECLKASNLLINREGRPILGRNLVESAPQLDLDCTQQLDRILIDFYGLVDKMLFGDKPFFPFATWSAVGERRDLAYLRPLMMLIAWKPSIDFRIIANRIFDVANRLRAIPDRSFSSIRQELLATDSLYHAFSFRPEIPWDAKLFDIGYVRGEEFVVLCNGIDKYWSCIIVERNVEISTSPVIPETDIKSFPGGIRRYKFCNMNHATMMRQLDSQKMTDTVSATRFLRDISSRIFDEYGESHGIRISDIILVVAISNYPSGASITFADETTSPPESFYFYCLPVPDWGYWSVHDTPTGQRDIDGARIAIVSRRQAIYFIQLQEEDCENQEKCRGSGTTDMSDTVVGLTTNVARGRPVMGHSG